MNNKDATNEGSSALSAEAYKKSVETIHAISSLISYQFTMNSLMCKLLAEADFLETGTTYNEYRTNLPI